MKSSFCISLFIFCLLMCSCKTQKSARLINEVSRESIQTEWNKFQAFIDTSSVLKLDIDKSKLTIIETIINRKYDKDTGVITEETTTERTIAQDSDKVVSEEGNQTVTSSNQLEVEHFRDITKKVDSQVKEESVGGQESFGKYFGIVLGCVIGLLILYLLSRVN